jgi:hypothetical protein
VSIDTASTDSEGDTITYGYADNPFPPDAHAPQVEILASDPTTARAALNEAESIASTLGQTSESPLNCDIAALRTALSKAV